MTGRSIFAVFLCLPLFAQTQRKPSRGRNPACSATNAPAAASGQEPFRTSVREVIVPVTVTDVKGRFVSDLNAKDFKIFDEGKEQKIEFFTRERNQPVVVGFLLDLSSASKIHWKTYQDAAIDLISTLIPNDPKYSGYLITYSTDAEVAVNTTQDSEKLIERVRKLKAGGGAALYDAIWMACTSRKLVKGEPFEPRRMIVVIGDGHDNASKKNIEQVLEIAQRQSRHDLRCEHGGVRVQFRRREESDQSSRRRPADAWSIPSGCLQRRDRLPGKAVG